MYKKYVFSGHESFPCRMLWPIKGYDYIVEGNNFNDSNSVVELGVGKNMVASIRYWLKVLGLTEQDKLTSRANYLFDKENGKDRYIESLGTLWLLHFLLVHFVFTFLLVLLIELLVLFIEVIHNVHVNNGIHLAMVFWMSEFQCSLEPCQNLTTIAKTNPLQTITSNMGLHL